VCGIQRTWPILNSNIFTHSFTYILGKQQIYCTHSIHVDQLTATCRSVGLSLSDRRPGHEAEPDDDARTGPSSADINYGDIRVATTAK